MGVWIIFPWIPHTDLAGLASWQMSNSLCQHPKKSERQLLRKPRKWKPKKQKKKQTKKKQKKTQTKKKH